MFYGSNLLGWNQRGNLFGFGNITVYLLQFEVGESTLGYKSKNSVVFIGE